MLKHPFQVGDRVRSAAHSEAIGHLIREKDGGWLMLRDDKVTGCYNPYWWVRTGNLQHDRDFKVGDWVRYEGVSDKAVPDKEGQVGQIINIDRRGYVRARGIDACLPSGAAPDIDKNNLVKIATPNPVLSKESGDKQEDRAMSFKKFNHADKVKLTEKGDEITSSSLDVGDQGVVKDHKQVLWGWNDSYMYRVVFNTQNGPRSQWVWEEHLKKVETEKDPMLKKLEEKVEECRIASEKASRAHEEAVDHLNHYKDLLSWVK